MTDKTNPVILSENESMKGKRPKPLPKRNFAAKQAINQKAGAIKEKRTGRGGAKATLRQDLAEAE